MAIKALLILSLFLLVTSTFANDLSSRREEEQRQRLEKCKEKCSELPHYDQGMQRQCVKKCLQQREQSSQEPDDEVSRTRPERRYEQCRLQCQQSKQGQQEKKCEHQCRQRFEEERREQGRGSYEEEESSGSSRRELQKKYEKCKQECSQSRQGEQQRWCKQQCEQAYEKQRRQEQEQEQDDSDFSSRDPQRKLEQCKQDCRESYQGSQLQEQRQRQCMHQCLRQFEKEQQRGQEQEFNPSQQEEEEQQKRWQQNPYVFEGESFNLRVRSEHGRIGLLPNFAKLSKLLLGIANNRVALLEANPNTFIVPNHFDADAVFYVVEGEGTITMLAGDRKERESHNIRRGEVIKVPAGTVVYIVNRSNNQKLRIAKLLKPISTPGQVEGFYTVGGEEPESYYRAFSTEILEAALNTRRDQLQRLFGRQKQGVIIKISEEQVRSLSRSSSEQGSHWPFGGGESSKRTYDLLNKRPTYSNKHGKFYEVDSDDFEALKDLNLRVTFVNITRGSMMVPFYNSEATKIAVVTNGRGYFEMACPHLSEQQQWKQKKLQKVRSELRRNTVFIVPAGHPIAVVASKEEGLEVVCFGVNSRNNMRTFVAGKNNVVSQMEKEAKELAFGVSSKIVDEVFSGEGQEEMFTNGPEKSWEREERQQQSEPLQSILDFTSF